MKPTSEVTQYWRKCDGSNQHFCSHLCRPWVLSMASWLRWLAHFGLRLVKEFHAYYLIFATTSQTQRVVNFPLVFVRLKLLNSVGKLTWSNVFFLLDYQCICFYQGIPLECSCYLLYLLSLILWKQYWIFSLDHGLYVVIHISLHTCHVVFSYYHVDFLGYGKGFGILSVLMSFEFMNLNFYCNMVIFNSESIIFVALFLFLSLGKGNHCILILNLKYPKTLIINQDLIYGLNMICVFIWGQ